MEDKYKYSDITEIIIGCAMRVHSALGNGFQEKIYQSAMEIEMNDSGLSFGREFEKGRLHFSFELGYAMLKIGG